MTGVATTAYVPFGEDGLGSSAWSIIGEAIASFNRDLFWRKAPQSQVAGFFDGGSGHTPDRTNLF